MSACILAHGFQTSKRRAARRPCPHAGRESFARATSEILVKKSFVCPCVHRKFTVGPQLFNSSPRLTCAQSATTLIFYMRGVLRAVCFAVVPFLCGIAMSAAQETSDALTAKVDNSPFL